MRYVSPIPNIVLLCVFVLTLFFSLPNQAGGQRLCLPSKLFQGFVWIVGVSMAITATLNVTKWIDFIYFFSYVKLFVTAIKYLPQLIFNFRRKSTKGWSIYMIYLDFFGGLMSMLQMLTLSYNFSKFLISAQ